MKIIPNLSDIEILTPDGYKPFSAIAIENSSNTLIFELEDGRKISTSMGHLFVFKQKMTVAKDLKVGDFINTVSGLKKIVNIKTGENMVHYGPLGVLGGLYLSNGIVNHNCQFIGSSTTLIAADALDQLTPSEPIDWKDGYALKIFENPQPGAMYLMGVDSANGSGKDYSVVQVIKIISKTKFEQVAVYACNTISAGKFSSEVKKISDAPIIIIWFGAGIKSIIIMSLLISVIITIINVTTSFEETDSNKIKLMKSFNANKYQIIK